jgi:hypothetical protein
MLPLKLMIHMIAEETDANVLLLGIQPKDLTFDGEMSAEIRERINQLEYACITGSYSQPLNSFTCRFSIMIGLVKLRVRIPPRTVDNIRTEAPMRAIIFLVLRMTSFIISSG